MASDKFNDGDRIFAKMKGYPAWPALVSSRVPGKAESYIVFFYGTYQSAKVKPECMYPYNDETRAKFGKAQRKGGSDFKLALDQIENNFEFGPGSGGDAEVGEQAPPPIKPEVEEDEEMGELVIDEEANLPPVLKREGKAPSTSTPPAPKKPARKSSAPKLTLPQAIEAPVPQDAVAVAAPPPPPTPKPARRGSKTNKKDLGLDPPTPEPPSTPAVPLPEVLTRSGRKIKPKRFADEEVQFSTPPSGKGGAAAEGKSTEATPAKRAKRMSTGTSKAAPLTPTSTADTTIAANSKTEAKSPLPPPPPLERPKLTAKRVVMVRKKGSAATAKASASATAAPPAPETPPPSLRPPPPLRAMPSLTPSPSISTEKVVAAKEKEIAVKSAAKPKPTAKDKEVEVKEPIKSSEEAAAEQPIESKVAQAHEPPEGQESKTDSPASSKPESPNPVTPDDPEVNDPLDSEDEGNGKENNLQEEPSNYENGTGEDSDEAPNVPKRMKVDLKNGTASTILGFNHDRPTYFRTEAAGVEYDMATARSVLHAKVQLEVNETGFLKSVADSLPPVVDKEEKEAKARLRTEQIQKKIAQLRMEGEIVEIIGELVGSLGVKFAYCDRALDLLDKLGGRTDVNTLALKKNPEIVDVIRKVQNYHGNVGQWKNLNQGQIEDFHVKAEMIREKAISIYQNFKLLFCTTAEKPFYDTFNEEVGKFNESITAAGIPSSAVIGLYKEPVLIQLEKDSSESTPSTILGDANGFGDDETEA